MAEIELKKRVVYAGDVHIALLKAGWPIREACDFVNGLPKADVAPVRHGEWTKTEDDWDSLTIITCSECHEEWCFETEEDVELMNYRYCPNCGARMDRGTDDEKHPELR